VSGEGGAEKFHLVSQTLTMAWTIGYGSLHGLLCTWAHSCSWWQHTSRSVPTLVLGDMVHCSIALMKLSCLKTICGFEFVCFFCRGAACDFFGFVCLFGWFKTVASTSGVNAEVQLTPGRGM